MLFPLMAILFPQSGSASERLTFEVAQPVWEEDSGHAKIVHVTYASNDGICCPELAYTCRPNVVMADGRAENRNVANLVGIEMSLTATVARDMPNWMCDTVGVRLDLRRSFQHEEEYGAQEMKEIIESTVQCIFENASNCGDHLRVLRLAIVGAPGYRSLGGTFRVTPRTKKSPVRLPRIGSGAPN